MRTRKKRAETPVRRASTFRPRKKGLAFGEENSSERTLINRPCEGRGSPTTAGRRGTSLTADGRHRGRSHAFVADPSGFGPLRGKSGEDSRCQKTDISISASEKEAATLPK